MLQSTRLLLQSAKFISRYSSARTSLPSPSLFPTKNSTTFFKPNNVIVRYYSIDFNSPFTTVTKRELEQAIHTATKENKQDYTLVDVRSQLEVEQSGKIPTANVIPLPEIESAFKMNDADFQKKFGFPKFKKTDKVIFYCRSGKRSEDACIAAKAAGFTNIHNYRGSAKEWFDL